MGSIHTSVLKNNRFPIMIKFLMQVISAWTLFLGKLEKPSRCFSFINFAVTAGAKKGKVCSCIRLSWSFSEKINKKFRGSRFILDS